MFVFFGVFFLMCEAHFLIIFVYVCRHSSPVVHDIVMCIRGICGGVNTILGTTSTSQQVAKGHDDTASQ